MKSYLGSTYATASSTGDYNTAYSYDANGNLKTLLRNAYGTNQSMDNFTYNYANEWNNNQLDHVHDPIDSTFWGVDIDNQSSGNYAYSPIGELIRDDSAYITQIQWRWSDSKVSKIKRTNSKDQVTFKYDAFGNRVAKLVKPTDAYGNTLSADQWTISIYARDAAGNVMAVYDYSLGASAYTLIEKEVTLYGSSRLGVKSKTQTVATYSTSTHSITTNTPGYPERDMGNKYYELSNHLGNVLSVITDRKLATDSLTYTYTGSGTDDYSYDANLPVEYYYTPGAGNYSQDATLGTDGVNDYYYADVETYSDYYPFGMLMPGRHSTSESYRYGFNGMEKDDEVKGISGGSYTTPFRQYDPRLGRWMSLDPLMGKYPNLSPYVAFNNNPIYFNDPLGLEGDDPKHGDTRTNQKGETEYYTDRNEWKVITEKDVNDYYDTDHDYKTFDDFLYKSTLGDNNKVNTTQKIYTKPKVYKLGDLVEYAENLYENKVFKAGTYKNPLAARDEEVYNDKDIKLKDTPYGKALKANIDHIKKDMEENPRANNPDNLVQLGYVFPLNNSPAFSFQIWENLSLQEVAYYATKYHMYNWINTPYYGYNTKMDGNPPLWKVIRDMFMVEMYTLMMETNTNIDPNMLDLFTKYVLQYYPDPPAVPLNTSVPIPK